MWISALTLLLALLISVALAIGPLRKIAPSSARRRKFIGWLGAALTVSGVALGISQGPSLERVLEIRSWVETTGTVEEATVTGQRASMPWVTYTYTVADSVYRATTDLDLPGFGSRGFRRQTAHRALADYPPGAEVTVFYNPKNPAESSLRRGFHWAPLARLSFGTVLFGAGVALALVFLRNPRSATTGF
ncbi:MAG: DUF3592 domain-containing protein [Candidatus Zixiibacteriota bacterium]